MDSPSFQSPNHPSRSRAHSSTLFRVPTNISSGSHTSATSTVDSRGAIHKRSSIQRNDRNRSLSVTQADRLYRLAAEQQHHISTRPVSRTSIPDASLGLQLQWITPQHSPQPSGFPEPAITDVLSQQWTVPTPPRSDSGIPNVLESNNDDSSVTCIGTSSGFDHFEPVTSSTEEMSSLGFLLPSQYGASPYESENNNYAAMDQNYIPPMRGSLPTSASGSSAYAPATSSNPALYQHSSRPSDGSARRYGDAPSSYEQSYRNTSNPYDPRSSAHYGQTIPPITGLTSPHTSPQIGQLPQYGSRPQSMYESSGMYPHSSYTSANAGAIPGSSGSFPYGSAPSANTQPIPYSNSSYHHPSSSGGGSGTSNINDMLSRSPDPNDSSQIRVLNQRPKPQCWEHGCNGRQFSTFSNLLRHQREKSGTAAKSYCPKCGAEFTRTTARNGHLAHDKCTKQRRESSDSK